MASPFQISAVLADDVCDGLGAPLPAGPAALDRWYRAWVARVPFDPVAKSVALRSGGALPGDDPVVVAERWLETGVGSTCWGHCTLMAGVLAHAGLRTSIAVERMRRDDDIVDFHSALIADIDGEPHLLDPVHASGRPLPLVDGATGDHPAIRPSFRRDEATGRLLHRVDHAGSALDYVLLATELDPDDVRSFLAVSATHSGVGRRFFLRRVLPDRVVRYRPNDDGSALEQLTSRTADHPLTVSFGDVDDGLAAAGLGPGARPLIEAAALLDRENRWAV